MELINTASQVKTIYCFGRHGSEQISCKMTDENGADQTLRNVTVIDFSMESPYL
ncbi:MAG: hypothetical protein GF311_12000 [Candidatus Lokiarchaeota archaeon]|nr:hypothetical protein [Candidatus Lokiarchaeota archaeon]